MPLEFVESQKGKNLLKYNGFLFRKEKTVGEKEFWRCLEYRTQRCRGRCHVKKGEVVYETTHNHDANIAKVQAKTILEDIRQRARIEDTTTERIIAQSTANIEAEVVSQLPSFSAMKRTVQRVRQQSNVILIPSPSFEELIIPDQLPIIIPEVRHSIDDSDDSE